MDAVVVTSASQVQNLCEIARREGRREVLLQALRRTLVASIGPVSSRTLREIGVDPAFEASPPKLGPLIARLAEVLKD